MAVLGLGNASAGGLAGSSKRGGTQLWMQPLSVLYAAFFFASYYNSGFQQLQKINKRRKQGEFLLLCYGEDSSCHLK